jgi:hypothetical protein
MRVATVESSTLARVAYEETAALLRLEFCNRKAYLYFDVPVAIHQALLSAPSKGRYFNQAIRGRFRYCLVPEVDAVPMVAEAQTGCDF